MIIIKEFDFDAAHYLPAYNGKCEHLHGHTYKLVVKVEGTPDHEGMVIDFIKLKNLVKEEVLAHLDHACLNDILHKFRKCLTLELCSSGTVINNA
mgnify:CR=1 FL=1